MARRRLLLPLLAVLALGAGCSTLQPAAATVNGRRISEEALQEEVDRVRDDPSFQELLRQQGDRIRGIARRQVLSRFIRETLVDDEANKRGVRVTSAQISAFVDNLRVQVGGPERFQQLLEQANLTRARVNELARRQILQQEMEKRLTANLAVDDAQVQAWYEQNASQLTEYHLQKLTVATPEEATRVVEQVNGGADFGTLARETSKDPSAAKEGDMGYVDAETLGGALAAQIDAAPVGALVGPVRGPSGHEVYKVLDKRAKPLDQVRSQIADQLLAGRRREAFDRWVAETLGKAKVVVNPKYGTFDRSTLTVVTGSTRLPE